MSLPQQVARVDHEVERAPQVRERGAVVAQLGQADAEAAVGGGLAGGVVASRFACSCRRAASDGRDVGGRQAAPG
ncbi:hypothetical protein [Saccharothrix australiensis]|uniref:hypothetical protein n=1 Tax=Saccharothrix australiensis TaxID=2072 RepID=UPI000EB4B024|nr:hypothetical protein [Saccharothrix australiensis]